jgi:hypothetical protein
MLIGYAQASIETNPEMLDLGFKSYFCSAMVDIHHRNLRGVGTAMSRPIMYLMDERGSSYLTTWVDNGNDQRLNHVHMPPVGFWFRQGFNFLNNTDANTIVEGIRNKHIGSGIVGRNYDISMQSTARIENLLGQDFIRHENTREIRPDYEIALLPNHYENNWTGVIMTREPR